MYKADRFTCEHYASRYTTRYNQLPSPLRPMTEKEFAQSSFFSYTAQFIEHRQAHFCLEDVPENIRELVRFNLSKNAPDASATMVAVQMFWYDEHSGIAAINDYWGGKVHWFAFGCQHEWKHTGTPYRCYNTYECVKCGCKNAVDSSD
jgi:hypothetical protein